VWRSGPRSPQVALRCHAWTRCDTIKASPATAPLSRAVLSQIGPSYLPRATLTHDQLSAFHDIGSRRYPTIEGRYARAVDCTLIYAMHLSEASVSTHQLPRLTWVGTTRQQPRITTTDSSCHSVSAGMARFVSSIPTISYLSPSDAYTLSLTVATPHYYCGVFARARSPNRGWQAYSGFYA